ncbi:MAG: polysulfide reductase NrfD [Armatimonadetes bacterium]|nr:polysulfide reductase NrfD [Armatimonadota bacterium]
MSFKAPDLSIKQIYDEVMTTVLGPRPKMATLLLMIILAAIVLHGVFQFFRQSFVGLGVTGLTMPVYWGIYIATFVFWIGVAHAGALISAILRITGAEWKSSITRIAEVITLFTLPAAASFPFIHMGRPGLFYYLIPYPNNRLIWPNFKSPLMWDFFAISTYFIGSVLFLYVTLIPDLGTARPNMKGWRKTLYTILSFGWRGTAEEWKRVKEAAALFSVLILPVVISVHTIVSWDFAMQLVPGWHSEVFGPYFFVGALYSGVAAVFTVMTLLKWRCGFKDLITPIHYDMLGRVFLALGLAWAYLFFNDFLPGYYSNEPDKMAYFRYLAFSHPYSVLFWLMFLTNFVLPIACLSFKGFRMSTVPMFLLSIGVNVGMYIERVLIVFCGTQVYNPLARNVTVYVPSFTEISIVAATFAGVTLGYMLFIRAFPILPIWELAETKIRQTVREIAGKKVYYFKSGE